MAQSKPIDEVREAALALPVRDRIALANELQESVEGDPEWARAFARELKRRSDDFKSGVDKGIAWPALRAQLVEKYRQKP